MILQDIFQYILTKLGGSGADIELQESDLDLAVKETIKIYSKYKPIKSYQSVTINSKYFTLPAPENTVGVCKVDITGRVVEGTNMTDEYILFNMVTGVAGVLAPRFTWSLAELEIARKWYVMVGRVLGTSPDWYYDYYNKILHIWQPSGKGYATVVWLRPIKYPNELDKIPSNDEWWIEQYALSCAKEILGRIRSKYDGIPGGNDKFALDGKDLLQESVNEKEKLMSKLLTTLADLPVIME